MIYLKLFLTFLKIGAVSFGGGYAMISLVKEEVLANGWMTEANFLDFIAISESTPGPIAINMATFVGSSQGGFLGALMATAGVVLPSFIIIILIAAIFNNLVKYPPVEAALKGIRPCVSGLIAATGFTMMLSTIFGVQNLKTITAPDFKIIIIFAIIVLIAASYKKIIKKKISPILLIIISAGLGIVFYAF